LERLIGKEGKSRDIVIKGPISSVGYFGKRNQFGYPDILSWAGYVVVLTDLPLFTQEIAAILHHIVSIIW
jgi:hypothetical protein